MSVLKQIEVTEQHLRLHHAHSPDLPIKEILASRILVYIGRVLADSVDSRVRQVGLGEMEGRALMSVYVQSRNGGSAYPGELCTNLGGVSPANLTRITDSLVQRGLIVRHPDETDRRRLGLRTTDQGAALAQTLVPALVEITRENFRDISPQDVDDLLQILKRIGAALDRRANNTESHV